MDFIIKYPTGFQVEDPLDDNLDINVVLEDGRVFFGTVFTLFNIKRLFKAIDARTYFWSTDMFIVEYLDEETLQTAIREMIEDGSFESILSQI